MKRKKYLRKILKKIDFLVLSYNKENFTSDDLSYIENELKKILKHFNYLNCKGGR